MLYASSQIAYAVELFGRDNGEHNAIEGAACRSTQWEMGSAQIRIQQGDKDL
ncbi:MAG: hypothetical protein OXC91_10655 [Rhodobacteraceae bacterium]|nr:hypothetical protein [Paracoccaceae bacterium]